MRRYGVILLLLLLSHTALARRVSDTLGVGTAVSFVENQGQWQQPFHYQAQLHNGIDDETVSEPEPEPVHIEEPQTLETPPVTNPFGDLEEPGETLETADEEATPKTRMPFGARKKKNKDSESKGKPNLGKQIMNSIDKYFNKVFNDSAIRNEGDEERDI